jgi:hypothetical protein
VAYVTATVLATGPLLLHRNADDSNNRLQLAAVTTAMGIFSVFLMTILYSMHEVCVWCITSAILSITLAKMTWLGRAVPKERLREGIIASAGTSLLSFATALAIFLNIDSSSSISGANLAQGQQQRQESSSLTLLADSGKAPPPILSSSSPRALEISSQLQSLDTHFYGAYWCSHCYEQKEELGKEAMAKIPYIECSKEGRNSQTQLCKEKNVPGYPTWEINGKLYPGEQALEELEDIIKENRK